MFKDCFAGNEISRCVFPLVVVRPKLYAVHQNKYTFVGYKACELDSICKLNHSIERGIVTNWNPISLHYIFDNELRVDLSKHPVLIIESPFSPKDNREKFVELG